LLNSLDTERDRVLVQLGIATGFRISELLSLRLTDIIAYDDVKGSITVERKHTKGKAQSRSIPVSKALQSVLQAYVSSLPKNQVWLFKGKYKAPLSRSQAWRNIKQAARKNKLEGKIATHSLRKSFAARVYKNSNKDLVVTKELMGHKNVNSTLSYLSFTKEELYKSVLGIGLEHDNAT